MTKQLTTQNATITTVAVEVKALAISGKQVTLSVFRQLQSEALVAFDGTLNGVPWGHVNYHPDRCSDEVDHWHIVWQKGTELRRSRVIKEPRWSAISPPEASQLLNSEILAWATDPAWAGKESPLPRKRFNEITPTFPPRRSWVHPPTGVQFIDEPSDAARQVLTVATKLRELRRSTQGHSLAWADQREASDEYQVPLAQLRSDVEGYGRSIDELMEDLCIIAVAYLQRQDRHRMTRAGLAQLPQLFIAV